MDKIDRVRDINRYLGLAEMLCKDCGVMQSIDDVIISETIGTKTYPIYKAHCPDCNKYLKRLRQSKTDRIWYKGSMIEIAKMETGLLNWMLKVNFGDRKTTEIIQNTLRGRIFSPKKDINMTINELKAIEVRKKIRGKDERLSEYEYKLDSKRRDIVRLSSDWNYYTIKEAEAMIKIYLSRIKSLNRELSQLKDTLNILT